MHLDHRAVLPRRAERALRAVARDEWRAVRQAVEGTHALLPAERRRRGPRRPRRVLLGDNLHRKSDVNRRRVAHRHLRLVDGRPHRQRRVRRQPAHLVRDLRRLRRRRAHAMAALRVHQIMVQQQPRIVARVIEGFGHEDAAAPNAEHVHPRRHRRRDERAVRDVAQPALELVHRDDVGAARPQRDTIHAEHHRVAPGALRRRRPRRLARVAVVDRDESQVTEADPPRRAHDAARRFRREGDAYLVERLGPAEPRRPPQPHALRRGVDAQRDVRLASGEGTSRVAAAPATHDGSSERPGARRGGAAHIHAHLDTKAGVLPVDERYARRRRRAPIADERDDVGDENGGRRGDSEVDRPPDPKRKDLGLAGPRVGARRPVPAAAARGEAAVGGEPSVNATSIAFSAGGGRSSPCGQRKCVPQELVAHLAKPPAVERDTRSHLDAIEDKRGVGVGGAVEHEAARVPPPAQLPERRVRHECILVERIAQQPRALQVGERVARHGRRDLDRRRRRAQRARHDRRPPPRAGGGRRRLRRRLEPADALRRHVHRDRAERVAHTMLTALGTAPCRALQPLRRAPQPAGGGDGVGGSGRRVGRGRAAAHIDALRVCARSASAVARGEAPAVAIQRDDPRRADARLGAELRAAARRRLHGGARHRPRRRSARRTLLVALARLLVLRAAPHVDGGGQAQCTLRLVDARVAESSSSTSLDVGGKICTLSRPWRRALSVRATRRRRTAACAARLPRRAISAAPRPARRGRSREASDSRSLRRWQERPRAASATQMHHEPTDARHKHLARP